MIDTSASVQELLDSGELVKEYVLQVNLILEGWTYADLDGGFSPDGSQVRWVREELLEKLEKCAEVRYPANDVRIVSRIVQAEPNEAKTFSKR